MSLPLGIRMRPAFEMPSKGEPQERYRIKANKLGVCGFSFKFGIFSAIEIHNTEHLSFVNYL